MRYFISSSCKATEEHLTIFNSAWETIALVPIPDGKKGRSRAFTAAGLIADALNAFSSSNTAT